MQRQETTITEDLLAYREHMKRWPTERDMDYADAIGKSSGWISNFSRYWNAIDGGVRLHRVILLHNGRKRRRCEDIVFKETLKLRCPKWSHVRLNMGHLKDDALLSPVDDATDEALRSEH